MVKPCADVSKLGPNSGLFSVIFRRKFVGGDHFASPTSNAFKYAIALFRKFGFSIKSPNPELQRAHNAPRHCPVVWLWSSPIRIFRFPQMAQAPSCSIN